MPTVEYKTLPIAAASLEVKEVGEGLPVVVSGYASTFGGDPDSYGDVIAPGAYDSTVKRWQASGDNLPMLFNHNPDLPIGNWPLLMEDARGLRSEGELTPGNDWARNVEASLRHKAVRGLSIGFRTIRASQGQKNTRILEEIELHEISVVTFPANRSAQVTGVKSLAEEIDNIRKFEAMLIDQHGFSIRAARLIAERGFKGFLDVRDERGNDVISEKLQDVRDERGGGGGLPSAAAHELLAALKGLRVSTPS